MITRRPSPPPVVERRRLGTGLHELQRRASHDRKIRAWHADDVEKREQEAFERKPKNEQLEEIITACVMRLRRANDPDVERRGATQIVGCDLADDATSHEQTIEDPRDPRIVIRPKANRWNDLKQARQMQSSASKVVTDPKMPRKMGWWNYLKDMRKRTED